MANINSFKEFLNKLDKITWVSPDKDLLISSNKTLVSNKGHWKMSYSIEQMTSLHDRNVPFRAVVKLWFDGQMVQFWGCVDNEENADFILWFIRKKNSINDALDKEERAARRTGEDMFNNL